MKSYFGYIRVSTTKQGTHGVSLAEQRAAIERYAAKSNLTIKTWFEERETAAKRGRPVFARMLSLLRRGQAAGILIHKIDRSARNLKDWADLGELIDAGVDVHFAADALDLNSRGGRLSADIQAVVAADYIRNLREETKKGFYGRLKQGFYPLAAPVGYLDQGGGKAKTPDPATAPFIRLAFELYASGRYSLHPLRDELVRRGFKTRTGARLSVSTLSKILNNPFYAGIIRLRRSNETFRGVHEPLVPPSMYDRVQAILKGKLVYRQVRHDFVYRRMFGCALCRTTLIGERQKGNVYYRCHTKRCETRGVREECLDEQVKACLTRIDLSATEVAYAKAYAEGKLDDTAATDNERAASTLAINSTQARLNRLTDALIDGVIEKGVFDERRATLTADIARLEERLANAGNAGRQKRQLIAKTLELAETLIQGYDIALPAEKREMLDSTTSNRMLVGKEVMIALQNPFEQLANRLGFQCGGPDRRIPRTFVTCDAREEALRSFIDSMLTETSKNPPEETAEKMRAA